MTNNRWCDIMFEMHLKYFCNEVSNKYNIMASMFTTHIHACMMLLWPITCGICYTKPLCSNSYGAIEMHRKAVYKLRSYG